MIFNSIIPNRIYKNQKNIPLPIITEDNSLNRGKGNIIIPLTNTMEETFGMLEKFNSTNELMKGKYTRYYTNFIIKDKIGMKKILNNQKKEIINKFKDFDLSKEINLITPSLLINVTNKKYNLIYDISNYLNLYFKYQLKTLDAFNRCEKFINFIDSKINIDSFEDYEKFIYISLNDWKKDGFGITKEFLTNPISIILAITYRYPELIDLLKKYKIFLFDDINMEFILCDFNLFKPNKIKNFKTLFKKFTASKVSNNIEDTEEISEEKLLLIDNNELDKENIKNEEKVKDKIHSNISKDISNSNIKINSINSNISNISNNSISGSKNITETVYDIIDEEIEEIQPDDTEFNIVDDIDIQENIEKKVLNNIIKKINPKNKDDDNIIKANELLNLQNKLFVNKNISVIKDNIIPKSDLSEFINTRNEALKYPKAKNFYKAYNEQKMDEDIDNAILSLNNTQYPLYVISKEITDTSDTLNLKRTFKYKLKDNKDEIHTVEFDIPIIIDDRYIYLGGNKKIIQNQQLLLPIIKSGPNEVQIVTFYNKIFIRTNGVKMDPKTETIKKFLLLEENIKRYSVKIGNCSLINIGKGLPLDHMVISKNITSCNINNDIYIFDTNKLNEILEKLKISNNIKSKSKYIIGYNSKELTPIIIDESKGENVSDKIIKSFNENEKELILSLGKESKIYTYAFAHIKNRDVPIIFLLCYWIGLSETLKRANINFNIVDVGTSYDLYNQSVIKFKDKWIIWDRYPFNNSLLLNGASLLNFSEYNIADMDNIDIYVDMLNLFYNNISTNAIALLQFKDFMIDFKSAEVLRDHNFPDNLPDLCIYACLLLNNRDSDNINSAKNTRIRSNEIFAQFVYQYVAMAYFNYRSSIYKKSPVKVSVNKNLVKESIYGISSKKLPACSMIEDASVLNPVLELEKAGSISFRGPSGINMEKAMTPDKRSFDPSMTGIIGISTSPDANVGIQRQLTLDPNITSVNGYLEEADLKNLDSYTGPNLFTPAELLSPIGVLHDDGQRTAMAYKQSKYMVMVDGSSPVLIGNKVESAIPYYLSRDFVIIAQQDGEVVDIKENNVIIKYKDGKYDSFTLEPQRQKNSAGGFYIEAQFKTDLKIGDKVKEGEVVAYNPLGFEKNSDDLSASMKIGVLAKMAILPNFDEYEDSCPMTESLSTKLATTIDMEQTVVLSMNAFVDSMVKVGDHVNVGDPLIKYDNSRGDPMLSSLLSGAQDLFGQDIMNQALSTLDAEYTGEVVDIRFYSSVDSEDLSDTLRPYVEDYWKIINKKNKVLEKYKNQSDSNFYKCGQLINEVGGKTEAKFGKILGYNVNDGVLIRIFIKHKDYVKKGDKVTNYTALKGINSNIIDKGLEPFSEFRPDEEVSTLMAPGAVLARKTPSIILVMFGNKVVIETKRKLKELWFKD